MKKKKIEEICKKGIDFLKKVKGNCLIVHDSDCDGICSASIFLKIFKKMKIKAKVLNKERINEKIIEKFDCLIFLDIPRIEESVIEKIKKKKVLIVDHHFPVRYPKKFVYINPRIYEKNAYIPTSCLSYVIGKEFLEKNEICWLGLVGTICDKGEKNCKWIRKDCKKIDEYIYVFANVVNSCRIFNENNSSFVAKVLAKSQNYIEILKGNKKEHLKILKWYFESQREIEKILKNFEKEKIEKNGYVFFEVKSKLFFKSTIASILAEKIKKKVLVVFQERNGKIEISLRRGKGCRKNLLKIVEKVLKKVKGSGGGHPQAAGLKIEKINRKKLIEIFMNI
ncbi:MAG: hypothetical protein B6U78_02205 [Candidatus Aenigmarchaeota archaeon ex4484_224]|nr:MAG: hypothetical protein B6U78_02205 [Candidatus Aenigmarchaeota archaeon ex4484_224]